MVIDFANLVILTWSLCSDYLKVKYHWVSYCAFAVAEFKLFHHISPTIFPNQQDITSSLMSKLSNESNKGQIRPAGVARFALEVCGRLIFLILYSTSHVAGLLTKQEELFSLEMPASLQQGYLESDIAF